jgi:hypothetical protein
VGHAHPAFIATMRNISNHFDTADRLLMFLGTIAGGIITLFVIEHLSPEQAGITSAILLAALTFATELSNPKRWWLCVGMLAGIITGLGSSLSETLAENRQPLEFQVRCWCWICCNYSPDVRICSAVSLSSGKLGERMAS